MRILRHRARLARAGQRGVALLLALLLLVVLIAITIQISVTTGTDARVARNDMTLSSMDLAIESALLQVDETLATDGEAASQGAAGAPAAPTTGGAAQPTGAPAAGGAGAPQQAQSTDSQKDEWYQPQRTEINEIRLRIFVQDEDSKYNVLNLANPDEAEAKLAHARVVRILDGCREGSREYDIDPRTAEAMVDAMVEYMQRRGDSKIPRPKLLTDVEGQDAGLPLTLEEFAALPPFEEHHFRDFRDRDGQVVHSIGSFLTVWTSLGVASDLPQAGKAGASGVAGAAGKAATSGNGKQTGATAGGKGGNAQSGGTAAGGTTPADGGTGAGGQGTAGAAGAAGSSSGPASSGGYAVNVNTAPAAVLKGLFDDRDIPPRLFDKILEYRNLEEEEKESDAAADEAKKEEEIQLDEYGREKIDRRIFDSMAELSEVDGFKDLPTEQQNQLNQILTTTSNVFSIYVVARRTTSLVGDMDTGLDPNETRKREETAGDTLVRVVRSVVWRRVVDDEVVLIPLVRWEILDYLPYEVLDYPPDDR